jgi:RNA-directed DNA polymerase
MGDSIRLYLRSGIMIDGIVSQRIEGTPQGSPLSPLLSNIILDELDKELAQRGLSFVRYADDCSIYVKSAKSAQRVLTSITKYIEQKLLLKVNQTKSKISRPTSNSLLGFSFYQNKKEWSIRILPKKVADLKRKCKGIVRRNNGMNIQQKIDKLAPIVRGWVNYFNIADAVSTMESLDGFIRVHLRMSQWKEWKNCRTRVKNLIQLGINKGKAYEWGNSSKGYCRVAHSPILNRALTNMHFTKLGYVEFSTTYKLT